MNRRTQEKSRQAYDVDIAIVGGGMVGSVLATLLADQPMRIAIIENKVPVKSASSSQKTDPRVYAITRASEQIFRSAGIWSDLTKQDMGHFRKMHVWDANGSGQITFDSQSLCEPTLGYIISHQNIESALHKKLASQSNVEWIQPASLDALITRNDYVELNLKKTDHNDDQSDQQTSSQRLKARLVVGADGANSVVRELTEIGNQTQSYDQTALVCEVEHEKPHDDVARQRFLETGPLAFLPLADPHRCSIVWSTTPDHADELLALSQTDFHQTLAESFEHTLGNVIDTSPRASFPLTRAHADHYTAQRVALIGDAAHRIHPLAGQGANLGFLDAATLAQVLLDHPDTDPGKRNLLRQYERWRKGHNLAVMRSMDGFKIGFGHTNPLVKQLRNLGLNLVDSSPMIKTCIMQQAMGLRGDVPDLAKIHHAV